MFSTRMADRDEHTEELGNLFRCARQGTGRIALISGAIGSGKTALLTRFVDQAVAGGAVLLEARGSEAESPLPFSLLRKILDQLPADGEGREDTVALMEMAAAGISAGTAGGTLHPTRPGIPAPGTPATPGIPAPRIPADAGTAAIHPAVHPTHGPAPDGISAVSGTVVSASADSVPSSARLDVVPRLSSLLLDHAERVRADGQGPLVVAVDNAHLGDEASLQTLLHLADRIRHAPVLIVLTEATHLRHGESRYRSELARLPHFRRLRLPLLTPAGVQDLLAGSVPTEELPRLAAEVHQLTGGNPLLVEALRADQETGPTFGQHAVRSEMYDEAVLDCVHRCGPDALAVARALSVLEDASSAAQLGTLLEVGAERVTGPLMRLRTSGLVEDGHLRDPLAPRIIAAASPPELVADLHRRVAKLLHGEGASASEVARHLVQVQSDDDPWTVPVLREAADHALLDGDVDFARRCLEAAARACSDDRCRAAIELRLTGLLWRSVSTGVDERLSRLAKHFAAGHLSPGDAVTSLSYLAWSGQLERVAALVEELADGTGTWHGAAEKEAVFAALHWLTMLSPGLGERLPDTGELPTGTPANAPADPPRATGRPGLRAVPTVPAPRSEPSAGTRTGGRPEARTDASEEARTDAPAEPGTGNGTETGAQDHTGHGHRADHVSVHAARAVSAALHSGSHTEALFVLSRYHLSDETVQPLIFSLWALIYADRLDLATTWAERLLNECRRLQAPAWQAMLTAVRAEVDLRRGNLADAEEQARAALVQMPANSWGIGVAHPVATLIQALTEMGRSDDALTALRRPIPEALLDTLPGLHYRRARGRWYMTTGRHQAALTDFRACGELMTRWGIDGSGLVPWRTDAAEALLAIGQPEKARTLAAEQAERVVPSQRRLHGSTLRVLGTSTTESQSRLKTLQQAVDVLEGTNDRLQLAFALRDLGSCYQATGDLTRARMLMRRTWHMAKSCGAEPLWSELVTQQQTTREREPAQPESAEDGVPMPTRIDSLLSSAEHRVAVLAAHGLTNREISAKLYITVSTVEQHLTRIYRKLRVKRRRDLPTNLGDLASVK